MHLGKPMEEYLTRFNGLVKLFRNARREGLIRARSIGGKKATGDVSTSYTNYSDSGMSGCSRCRLLREKK